LRPTKQEVRQRIAHRATDLNVVWVVDARLDEHDPPLLGLLADFLAGQDDPWFDGIVDDKVRATLHFEPKQQLWAAVDVGHVPLVERALNAVGTADWWQLLGTTILHHAVRGRPSSSRVQIVRILLERDAPVNVPDLDGRTVLYEAASSCPAIVELLLARGADALLADNWGESVLQRAENADIVRLILAAGHVPGVRSQNGETPLHRARTADKVRLLLEAGGDPHSLADQGRTTLHHPLAADAARLLLKAGVDPNAADRDGCTPLMCQRDARAMEALLKGGARIDAVDAKGRSAIHHLACTHGSEAVACLELLVDCGADPTSTDNEGKTALDLAREQVLVGDRTVEALERAMRGAPRKAPRASPW
jgi:ankyrin repeat protein